MSYNHNHLKSWLRDTLKSPYKAALLTLTLLAVLYYPYYKTKIKLRRKYKIEQLDVTTQKPDTTSRPSYYTYPPPIGPPPNHIITNPATFNKVSKSLGSDERWKHARYFGWDDCGPICDTESTGPGLQTKFYPFISKPVNCRVMMGKLTMGNDLTENAKTGNRSRGSASGEPANYGWPPPREPPAELYEEFTMAGKMPLVEFAYFAERHNGRTRNETISQKEIGKKIMARAKRKGMSTYGAVVEDLVQVALSKYANYIENKTGCDFGSSANTWLTTLALLNGAEKMYVVDYQAAISTHPRIQTMTPLGLYKHWLASSDPSKSTTEVPAVGIFDFVISYSSVEHSGLGRYGDRLNPYGDLIAMSQIWCSLKPGSLLFLNVPYNPKGSALVWNAHRIYGPDRMAHLTANFQVLDYMDVCTMTRGLFCEHGTRLVTTLWVLRKN